MLAIVGSYEFLQSLSYPGHDFYAFYVHHPASSGDVYPVDAEPTGRPVIVTTSASSPTCLFSLDPLPVARLTRCSLPLGVACRSLTCATDNKFVRDQRRRFGSTRGSRKRGSVSRLNVRHHSMSSNSIRWASVVCRCCSCHDE